MGDFFHLKLGACKREAEVSAWVSFNQDLDICKSETDDVLAWAEFSPGFRRFVKARLRFQRGRVSP